MNVDGDEVVFLCARPVPHFLLRFQDTQCGVALQALGGKSCCWNFIFIVWNELHLDLFSVRFCASLTVLLQPVHRHIQDSATATYFVDKTVLGCSTNQLEVFACISFPFLRCIGV